MIPFSIEVNKKTSLHSFTENQIHVDGEALVSLTEKASEILIPEMGHRMKFLKLMRNVQSEESTTTVRPLEDSASEVEEVEKAVQV